MSDFGPRLRDAYPFNDSFNAMEVATADRRFEQLIERRERLIERSRFGILALNGASVVGILSSYDELKTVLGVDPRYALAFFGIGMILAVVSIFSDINFLGSRAAQMFGHLSALRLIRATLDDHLSERSEQRLGDLIDEMGRRSERGSSTKIELDENKDGLPNDFVFSPIALGTMNCAAGSWIGGAIAIMWPLLF